MKKTLRKKLNIVLCALVVLAASGCASSKAIYVDPKGENLITNVDSINVQDFSRAADDMVASLINNLINPGMLKTSVPGEPSLMAISNIQNYTGSQLHTDQLTKKIRVALLRTGRVQTTTTIGLGGPEDSLAAELQQQAEFLDDGKRLKIPDYTLSGKIIEDRSKAGRIRQSAFIFQLSLTYKGVAVWEDEKTIVKQGKRASVGF